MKIIDVKEEGKFFKVTIEEDEEFFKNEYLNHFNRVIKNVSVPGFRKGKSPFDMAIQYLKNRGTFAREIQDLARDLIEKSTVKIAQEDKELDAKIFGFPVENTIEVLDLDKWILKFSSKFEKFPTVTLGDYSRIETLIEHKNPQADICPVSENKEVEKTDVVAIAMLGKDSKGKAINKYVYDMIEIDMEKTKIDKAIVKALIGAKIKDKKEAKVKYREEEINVEMWIIDVRKKENIDDELVKKLRIPGVSDVDSLKKAIIKQYEVHNSYVRYQDILKWLSSNEHVIDPVPQENLRREAHRTYNSLVNKGHKNVSFENLFFENHKHLRTSLVLDAIAKKEKITEVEEKDKSDFLKDIDEHPWLYGNKKSEEIFNCPEDVLKEYIIQFKTIRFLTEKWCFCS